MTWGKGRRLSSVIAYSDDQRTSYTYDSEGIRTSKTGEYSGTVNFVTQNGLVVQQYNRYYTMNFFYDAQQRPFAVTFKYTDSPTENCYYYMLNLQGDVVGLTDTYGNVVAQYEYDPWGKVVYEWDNTPDNMGYGNPLRYRGYYWDDETGFYYLQSRYYDPNTGRFINADAAEYSQIAAYDINGTNLFAYCKNNPITYGDDGGEFANMICGAIVGGIAGAINAAINGEKVLAGALIGAGTGALAGLAVDAAIATGGVAAVVIAGLGGAAASGLNTAAVQKVNYGKVNLGDVAIDAGFGAVGGLMTFGVGGGSLQKVGGKLLDNMKKNFVKTFVGSTARRIGGRMVKYSAKRIARNIIKNVSFELANSTIITSGFSLISAGYKRTTKGGGRR